MSAHNNGEGESPSIPFTEYFTVLYNTHDIQMSLKYLVRLFAKLYIKRGTGSDKMVTFNNAMKELRVLDHQVEKAVISDIHDNAIAIDLGV